MTVLCGPVLGFTAVLAWGGAGSGQDVSFLYSQSKREKKKGNKSLQIQKSPQMSQKQLAPVPTTRISRQKYLTGHKCITIVLNSDHFTTHVFIMQTKTATVYSEEKQNILYSSPKISITLTNKIPNKQVTLFPN